MVIILTAVTKRNTYFYLATTYKRAELQAIRLKEQFFCPSCGAEVILKIGDVKTPHFSHKSLSECESFSEPESPLHLQGKHLLHSFFHHKQLTVEIEKYLPAIRQRADLLIGRKTAIEFQCSPISASQVASRTAGYRKLNINALWIGGIKDPPKEGIQIIRLKLYERELLQKNKESMYLLSFLPEDNRFLYYSNLFYVSGNRWIGKSKYLPAEKQSFPFAVPRRLSKEEFLEMWILFSQTRKQFITSQFYARNRLQNIFWRSCYELQLDVRKLPETIGIPLPKAEMIQQNAVLWQLQAINAFKKGKSMASLIRSGKLTLAGFASEEEVEKLLEDYLEIYRQVQESETKKQDMWKVLYEYYCKNV